MRSISRSHILLLLIIMVGVALRLWLISVSPLDPAFSNADDGDYYRRALRFALTGQYLDDAWLIRPPLHVFFFAAWIRLAFLTGQALQAVLYVQLAQTLVGALTIALGYGVARRLFDNSRAGLFFASFLAIWYPFVEQADVLFSELLYLFLFLLHVWLLLRFRGRGSGIGDRETGAGAWGDLFASGIALGLAALTRSPALYSLAFVVLWLLLGMWRPGAEKGSFQPSAFSLQPSMQSLLRQLLIVSAGCLLVVLPWTARNYALYGHLIPVDTLGQINLWLDLDRVEDRTPNIEVLRTLPQSERASYAMARARELLAERPLRLFDNAWPNFQHIWKAQFVEDYFLKSSFFTRALRETAILGLAGDILWLIFTLAGLVGLAGRPREGWHWRVFFLAWIGYSMLTVIVFHVEPRYLTPLWTLLGLYGAGTLGTRDQGSGIRGQTTRQLGIRHQPSWRLYTLLQGIVVLAFLVLLISYRDYPTIIGHGMARERAMSAAERAYQQGGYVEAERLYAEALQIQPSFVDAKVGLALALAAQNKYEQAQAAIQSGGSRQADLLGYTLLAIQSTDQDTVSAAMKNVDNTMAISGEDSQAWLMRWLRRPASAHVILGTSADPGRIQGFHAVEQSPAGSYRWLRGQGVVQLTLDRPAAARDKLVLRLSAGQAQAVPLLIRVNHGPAQYIEVRGTAWRRYMLSITPTALGSTQLQVTLSAPGFVPALRDPDSNDLRFLSLMVSEVGIE